MSKLSLNSFLFLLLFSTSALSFSENKAPKITDRILTKTDVSGKFELFALPHAEKLLMGYSDKAVPSGIEMPEPMKKWIDDVQRATEYAEKHPNAQLGAEARKSLSYPSIAPLLGNIEWGQDAPFDTYCPKGTPVGCVATATAQVMYYWRYPAQGSGSHSYTHGGQTHSVDFSAQTYNWDLMFDKYNNTCTPEQAEEVAKLSYHVGVSIDMQYSAGGSGAWTEFLPQALSDYFGYNPNSSNVWRQNYSYDDWNTLLITELEAGRPIIFAGNSEDAGHAFVIDGINEEGLYHVNWGWNGYYNGFYDICILNPGGAGIGANITDFGFCFSQLAMINLTPEHGVGEKGCPVILGYVSADYRSNKKMHFWSFIENIVNENSSGEYGIDIVDSSGNNVLHIVDGQATLTSVYSFHGQDSCFYTYLNPSIYADSLPDGEYEIKPFWRPLDSDCCYAIPSDYYNYEPFHFSIVNSEFGPTPEQPNILNIQTSNFLLQGQQLSSGRPYKATVDVYNAGNETFVGTLYMNCSEEFSPEQNMKLIYIDDNYLHLEPGETRKVSFTLQFAEEGEWQGNINAYNRNIGLMQSDCMTDGAIQFSYKYDENSPAKPVLLQDPTLLNEKVEADGEISFELEYDNKGGIYNDALMLKFFTQKLALTDEALSLSQMIEIPTMAENQKFTFTDTLKGLKSMKKYYARFFIVNIYGEEEPLQKYKSADSFVNASPIEIKVQEPTGIEELSNDSKGSMKSYDLLGRRVYHKPSSSRLLIRNNQLIHASSVR